MNEEMRGQGRVGRVGFGGAEVFANNVKVTKSDGKGLGWVAEKEFDGEAADINVSAADGVKEGGLEEEPRARKI